MTSNINKKNIIIIDKRVQDYEIVVNSINPEICIPVLFDYRNDTIDDIKTKIDEAVSILVPGEFLCIGLLQHNYNRPIFKMIASADSAPVSQIASYDPELVHWTQFREFILWCKTEYNILYFDLMACALYSDNDWKYIIDTLTLQTGVTIRASADDTGNVALGGNWFLESHTGVNLKDIYFTDTINDFKGILNIGSHTLLLRTGAVYSTGWNAYGQLGLGWVDNSNVPTLITNTIQNLNIIAVSCGNEHSLFLTNTGTVYACGIGTYGGLGIDSNTKLVPTLITNTIGTLKIIAISCGDSHSLFVTDTGTVYSTGWNPNGQLGLGDTTQRNVPTLITTNINNVNIIAISCGDSHSLFLTNTGKVYSTGLNSSGQLGLSDITQRNVPTLITTNIGNLNIIAISTGYDHSLFLTNTGAVYSCGRNNEGQLGLADTLQRTVPTLITNIIGSLNILSISSGDHHSLFRTSTGNVYSTGNNNAGQLGLNDTVNKNIPTLITNTIGSLFISSISCGDSHSLFLTNNYIVYSTGSNNFGQLGLSDTTQRIIPTALTGNYTGLADALTTTPLTKSNSSAFYLTPPTGVSATYGPTWSQLGSTIFGANANDSMYDISISKDGNIIAVSSPGNDSTGTDRGFVKVYYWNGSSWVQRGETFYGISNNDTISNPKLSSDGNYIAFRYNDSAVSNKGFIGIFVYDSNKTVEDTNVNSASYGPIGWSRVGGFIYNEFVGDNYTTISLSGNGQIIALGCEANDGTSGSATDNRGSVRVYKYNPNKLTEVSDQANTNFGPVGWTRMGTDIDGENAGDNFGSMIELSTDGTVLAGAAVNSDVNGTDNGQVRVFKWNTSSSTWVQRGRTIYGQLNLSGDTITRFAYALSLSADGNIVACGNSNYSTSGGITKILQWNSTNNDYQIVGQQLKEYSDGQFSGHSVSLSSDGQIIAVGAYDADIGLSNNGAVRVYKLTTYTTTLVSSPPTNMTGYSFSDTIYRMTITGNSSTGSVWGTNLYTADSNIARAAVHAGVISNGETKEIYLKMERFQYKYFGSTRNGVTTTDYTDSSMTYLSYYFMDSPKLWIQIGNEIIGPSNNSYIGLRCAVSGNGTRFITGGTNNSNGLVQVYSLSSTDNYSHTSSINSIAEVYGDIVIPKKAGFTTIASKQSSTITTSLLVITGTAPTFTSFPSVSKFTTDSQFTLTLPESNSTGAFTLTTGTIGTTLKYTRNALRFDGVNDTVILNSFPTLNSTNQLTLEGWVFVTTFPSNIITLNDHSGIDILADGKINTWLKSATSGWFNIQSSSAVPLNTWFYIAIVKNDNGYNKIYINNNIVNNTADTSSGNLNTCIGISLAANAQGSINYSNIILSEFRIWSVARTEKQIRDNYNREVISNSTGLQVYYKFNQGTAGSNNAGLTTLTDSTSNNYHGTLTNFALSGSTSNYVTGVTMLSKDKYTITNETPAIATINPDVFVNALNFNGTNNYIDLVSNITELGQANFTIECWIKTSGSRMGILNCQDSDNPPNWEAGEKSFYLDSSGKPAFVGFGNNFILSTQAVDDNNWHHVAVVWSYSTSTGFIYIDGQDRTNKLNNSLYQGNFNNTGRFIVGVPNNADSVNYFSGSMCELRIWSTARTTSQIYQNFRRILNGNETGLICYNRLNQGTANGSNSGLTTATNNMLLGGFAGSLASFSLVSNTSNWTDGITLRPNKDVTITGVGVATITAIQEESGIYDVGTTSATVTVALKEFSSILTLDGVDDAVNVGIPAWTYSTQFRTTMTVECWFRTTDTNNQKLYTTLFSRNITGGVSSTSQFSINMLPTGEIGFGLTNNNNNLFNHTTSLTYKDAQWHHVVGTYDSATGTKIIYIDGIAVKTDISASFGLLSNNNTIKLIFGSDDGAITNSSTDRQFRGSLSDIRIWSVVRTASEISNNYKQRLIGNETGLLGYWKLNQGYGSGWNTYTIALDSTSNRSNGTLTNFTTASNNWTLSTLAFLPRISDITLGSKNGLYNLSDSSFTFTDPLSNSFGNFSYAINSAVATISNGSATTKTVYTTSGAITIPTLSLYDFPEIASLADWEINVSFNVTGGNGTWRALLGDMYNEINSRGWAIWVSPATPPKIFWSFVGNTFEPAQTLVSLNTPYILNIVKSSTGTITLTLQNVSGLHDSTIMSSISNLVASYSFDSNINDSSGNSNNLTNVNNVTFNTSDYKRGSSAASFNGSNYFEIANDGRFSPDNFTVSLWIKPVSHTIYQSIASCRASNPWRGWMLYIGPSSDGSNLELWSSADGTNFTGQTSVISNFGTLNKWVHLAFTLNKSTSALIVYVNGIAVTTTTLGYTNNTGTNLRIGAGTNEQGPFFNLVSGTLIDDFRFYNKVLTATEIASLVSSISNLVAAYNFDSNGNDSSFNNNNLTNVNTVTFNTTNYKRGFGATSFNGTNHFEIANDGKFSPDNFTVACWIKPVDSSGNYQSIATCRDGYTFKGWMIYISPSNNLEFITGSGSGWSYNADVLLNGIGTINTWVHIAFTLSKSTNTVVVYINGTLQATITRTYINNNSYPLRIGAGGDVSYGELFLRNGTLVDDFRFYNKVLTAAEIGTIVADSSFSSVISIGSNVIGKGPVTIGGWRSIGGEIFPGTISNVNVKVPTNQRLVTLVSNTSGTPATITATQDSFIEFDTGTKSASLTIGTITPTLSNFTITAKDFGSSPFSLTAPTSNSGGAFTYTSSNTAVATISGSTVTIVSAGTSTIEATQASTTNYTSGTITGSLVVSPIAPTLSTFIIPGKNYGDAPFSLTAPTSNSGGAFTYTSSNTAVATISGSTVTIIGAGTSTITATQAASGNYTSGTITATFTVNTIAPTMIITAPGSITQIGSYITNSVTQVGQSLTHAIIGYHNQNNIVKISANGTIIGIGGIGGNDAGIVRMYGFANGTWTQIGGDIVGSSAGVYAGVSSYAVGNNTISMSGDGTLLTTVQSGLGYQVGLINIYKYDASKSTAQTNSALANYGPAKWSRITTISMTGSRSKSAVLSKDGCTMVVSDFTLRMYRSDDGGVTWTQRGTTIIDPANGTKTDAPGFSNKISVSANGLTVLAATEPMNANGDPAQLLCYEWNGSTWIGTVLRTLGWGGRFAIDISADGNVCLFGLVFEGYSRLYRYTKNGSGIWTMAAVVDVDKPWVSTLTLLYELWSSIEISANGSLVSFTKPSYGMWSGSTELGDAEVYFWNGSAYEAVINNHTIKNRTGSTFVEFDSMISSDVPRVVVGGVGKVDVYDLTGISNIIKTYGDPTFRVSATSNSPGTFTYTSSNTSIATISDTNLITIISSGTSTITATQASTTNYTTSNITVNVIVNRVIPTITNFTVPAKNFNDTAFSLIAPTSNSSGAFTYTSSNTAVATISGSTVTIVSAGSSTITATQALTTNYTSSTITSSLVVSPIAPTLSTFTVTGKNYGDAVFNLTPPTTNSSGAFTYTSSNTAVATISGSTVTILGGGTTTITATQAASGNYASGTITSSFVVSIPSGISSPTFTKESNQWYFNFQYGGSTQLTLFTINLTWKGGFHGTISFNQDFSSLTSSYGTNKYLTTFSQSVIIGNTVTATINYTESGVAKQTITTFVPNPIVGGPYTTGISNVNTNILPATCTATIPSALDQQRVDAGRGWYYSIRFTETSTGTMTGMGYLYASGGLQSSFQVTIPISLYGKTFTCQLFISNDGGGYSGDFIVQNYNTTNNTSFTIPNPTGLYPTEVTQLWHRGMNWHVGGPMDDIRLFKVTWLTTSAGLDINSPNYVSKVRVNIKLNSESGYRFTGVYNYSAGFGYSMFHSSRRTSQGQNASVSQIDIRSENSDGTITTGYPAFQLVSVDGAAYGNYSNLNQLAAEAGSSIIQYGENVASTFKVSNFTQSSGYTWTLNGGQVYKYLTNVLFNSASMYGTSIATYKHKLELINPDATKTTIGFYDMNGSSPNITMLPLNPSSTYTVKITLVDSSQNEITNFLATANPYDTATFQSLDLNVPAAPSPTLSNFTVPAKNYGATPFDLTAPTSNSSGAFTYTSSNTDVATISGITVTIVGGGSSTITATQADSGIYGSGTIIATLVVSPIASSLSNFTIATKYFGQPTFTITAPTTNSNGVITYTSSNTAVATISGTTVTILSVGTSTITATLGSTANYTSGSVVTTLTVNSYENANLTGLDLAGSNLTGLNLSNSTLTNVKSGSIIGNPTLPANYILVNGYIIGPNVNLTNVNLSSQNLTNANFTGANLTGANLTSATLTGLVSGSITGTPNLSASYSIINGYILGPSVNLSSKNLSNMNLLASNLTNVNLNSANIDNTDFSNTTLTGVKSGSVIGAPILPNNYYIINGCIVGSNVDLTGANLLGSNLSEITMITPIKFINAFDDFISGPTPQSTSNDWQYFEVNTDRSSASLLSNWQIGTGNQDQQVIYPYGQWDNNRAYGAYPSVQKVNDSGLIQSGYNSSFTGPALVMHPDNTYNVGMAFKNTTGNTINISIDIALSLLFPNYPSMNSDGVNYFIQRGLINDTRYKIYISSNIPAASTNTFTFNKKNIELQNGEFIYLILNRNGNFDWDFTRVVFNVTVNDLKNLTLTNVNFTNANLSGTNLSNVTLTNCNVSNTDFRTATLTNLISSGLTGTPLLSSNYNIVNNLIIGPNVNLTNENLSNQNLTNINLSGTTLTGANLTSATLTGVISGTVTGTPTLSAAYTMINGYIIGPNVNLTNATLTSQNLTNKDLSGTNLTSANLTLATLTGVISGSVTGTPTLSAGYTIINGYIIGPNVNLTNATLNSQNLTNAVLTGANLTNANLTSATLSGVLSGSVTGTPTLSAVYTMINGYVVGPSVNLTNATLNSQNLTNKDLSGTNLTGANLTSATLTGVLSGSVTGTPSLSAAYTMINGYIIGPNVNLTNAILNSQNLTNKDLSGTNLTGANLTNATFTGVISGSVTGTPTFNASYSMVNGYIIGPNVNLTNATLSNQNLSSKDLTGTTLTGANLSGITVNTSTVFTNAVFTNVTSGSITGTTTNFSTNYNIISGYIIGPSVNLVNATLSGANLSSKNLTDVNLTGANLTGANLSSVTINSNTNFTNSTLTNVSSGSLSGTTSTFPTNYNIIGGYVIGPSVNLSNATLSGLNLSSKILTGVNFTNANLTNVVLTGSTIDNSTNITNATLTNVTTGSLIGTSTNFSSSYNLINGYVVGPSVNLTDANLSGQDLTNKDLSSANLTNVNLTTATLTGLKTGSITGTPTLSANYVVVNNYILGPSVNLTNANLANQNLTNVNLSGANLSGTVLTDATLTGLITSSITGLPTMNTTYTIINGYVVGPSVNLANANLSGQDLTGKDLTNVNLSNANLSDATTTNIILSNTNINNANLTNITFSNTQKVQLLKNTNNRSISGVQIPTLSGTDILSLLQNSTISTINNISSIVFKVIPPSTENTIDLSVVTTGAFYIPSATNESIVIDGKTYYSTSSAIINSSTGLAIETLTFGTKIYKLFAGSVVGVELNLDTYKIYGVGFSNIFEAKGTLSSFSNSITAQQNLAVVGTSTLTGNVGINKSPSDTYKVDVLGTVRASLFTTTSDYRIKEDINNIQDIINIDDLKPVKYKNKLNNKMEYGFIAHEVQDIFPEIVEGDKDGEEYQSINYSGLIPILVNEIKKLKEEIKNLKK